jgi:membrane protease YdiL (CAAX protease family)
VDTLKYYLAEKKFQYYMHKKTIPFLLYALLITVNEFIFTFIDVKLGFFLYLCLLVWLFSQVFSKYKETSFCLDLAITLIPLIRVLSISLPLTEIPFIFWYLILSIPLFIAGIMIIRVCEYKHTDVGFVLKNLPLQLLIGLGGIPLGFFQYLLLKPAFIIYPASFRELLLSASILSLCAGLLEEFLFRGILYGAAEKVLGSRIAVFYTSFIYVILHISYKSLTNMVFVFAVTLFWNRVFIWQRSIVGLSLAHGLLNITACLICPLILS